MTPGASVVALVVTFNRAALLHDALAALHAQTHPLTRILVVDNASTDATAAVLAAWPEVERLRLPENTGAAGGFEAGLAHLAGAEEGWIWMMDDDVRPAPETLARLLAHAPPDALGVTPVKVGPRGHVQPGHAGTYSVARMQYRPHPVPPPPHPLRVAYASFVGLLVRAETAARVRPRPDFFIWHDDIEYTLRLAQEGPLYLVPQAVMEHREAEVQGAYVHRIGRTVPTAGTWRVYYALRNRMLTNRAHGTRAERLAGRLWATYYLLRSLGTTFVHYRADPVRLRLLVRAYADGLRGRSGARVRPNRSPR